MNENETQPTPEVSQPPVTKNKEGGLGATIASIIIILVIILGAFYFFNALKAEKKAMMNESDTASQEDSVNSIEAELEAENFDDLDAEMEAIEAEFEASAN